MLRSVGLAALALSLTSSLSGQDLFDEAAGGQWEVSKNAWITLGALTTARMQIRRHQALGTAEVRVALNPLANEPRVPELLALKFDGEGVLVLHCELVDIASFAESRCPIEEQALARLLRAKNVEIQIGTSTERLKPKILSPRLLSKLQHLGKQ